MFKNVSHWGRPDLLCTLVRNVPERDNDAGASKWCPLRWREEPSPSAGLAVGDGALDTGWLVKIIKICKGWPSAVIEKAPNSSVLLHLLPGMHGQQAAHQEPAVSSLLWASYGAWECGHREKTATWQGLPHSPVPPCLFWASLLPPPSSPAAQHPHISHCLVGRGRPRSPPAASELGPGPSWMLTSPLCCCCETEQIAGSQLQDGWPGPQAGDRTRGYEVGVFYSIQSNKSKQANNF